MINDGVLIKSLRTACRCPIQKDLTGASRTGGSASANKFDDNGRSVELTYMDEIIVSTAALDAVRSSCQTSDLRAVATCVYVLSLTLRPVLDILLYEDRRNAVEVTSISLLVGTDSDYSNGSGGWLGGDACKCLLYRVSQWIVILCYVLRHARCWL